MVITSRRGERENIATYEFICDEAADLQKIEPRYVTMGSVAIVLQGDAGFEVYMANSKKEWILLGANSTTDDSGGTTSDAVDQGAADYMVLKE